MPIRRNIGNYITANPTAPTSFVATGVWGLVQQLLASAANIWPFVRDPDFDYVTLLLPGNGSNGAQNNTFLDASVNNFTITRSGDTTQGSFSPYGDLWSNYFDGSGDYLSAGSNAAFAFGTGDFTVECWFYTISSSTQQVLVSTDITNGFFLGFDGGFNFGIRAVSSILTYTPINYLNSWNHVAVSRSGTTVSMFFNGVRVATATNSTNFSLTGPLVVGALPAISSYYLSGYISNVRIVKGTAVYNPAQTALSVPTAPLTAISGTSLLTCQSNRFRDASTNNFAITRNGDVRVTNFAPFNPTNAYSPAVNGGSGYFDGSGDYTLTTGASAFAVGTGAFTLEGWLYLNAINAGGGEGFGTLALDTDGSGDRGVSLFLTGSGAWRFRIGRSVAGQFEDFLGTTTLTTGRWYHFKIVRASTATNDTKVYLNGVQEAVGTSTIGLNMQKFSVGVAYPSQGVGVLNGYASDVRFTNNAQSSSIPTAPLTAVTGTQYLLNFTNAGIVDASAKNDLTTVGNAQISTAQSKFGGSSMAFDGSGDYLVSNSAAPDLYAFGSGDFTIEMWLNINASQTSGIAVFFDSRPSGTNGAYPCLYYSSGTIRYYVSTADRITSSSVSTGTWLHVAICRSGSSTKMFVNGTQAGSTYTDTTAYLNPAQRPFLGASGYSVGDNNFAGYIDDLRITKGVARYTANFTPPAAPFPLG